MTDEFMRKELIEYARNRAPWWLKSDFDFSPVRPKKFVRFLKSPECCVYFLCLLILLGGFVAGALLDRPH